MSEDAGAPGLDNPSPDLARDLRAVVRDAEALLRQAAGNAGTEYDAARAKLEASLRTARDQLASTEAALRENARRAGRAADDYVHRHPWESVGIGAVIGLALGLLVSRR